MRANQQTALVSDRVVLVPYRSVLSLAGRFNARSHNYRKEHVEARRVRYLERIGS